MVGTNLDTLRPEWWGVRGPPVTDSRNYDSFCASFTSAPPTRAPPFMFASAPRGRLLSSYRSFPLSSRLFALVPLLFHFDPPLVYPFVPPSFSLPLSLALCLSLSSRFARIGVTLSLRLARAPAHAAFSIVIAHASDLSRGSLRSPAIPEPPLRTLLHTVHRSTHWTLAGRVSGKGKRLWRRGGRG